MNSYLVDMLRQNKRNKMGCGYSIQAKHSTCNKYHLWPDGVASFIHIISRHISV